MLTENNRNLLAWVQAEVHPSADELAELFWAMDSEEQAFFFNLLGEKDRLVVQLQAISDSPYLNASGRHAMVRIGEYGEE